MNVICRFCSAFRFQGELLNCCHNGKICLPSLQECPLLLQRLLECDNHETRNYRDNIRNYHAAFSFAFFGADVIMPPGRGFTVSACKVRHIISFLVSIQTMMKEENKDNDEIV
ncbi:hypothetical protein FHG87_013268 [Trinorchestia longiramus]|nr:hypothetical protein FHG87_013268 [Trinorchestia longiramus]